ncbi:MAG TPA: hypothetical protein VMA34_15740 [Terracidiphilus sp.]|nr:hypothetical protein [Terracidiphilus sp.]
MSESVHHGPTDQAEAHGHGVHLPRATAWPIILAFGFTLLCAGLVTTLYITLFGALFMTAGCVGWFRQVFPHEQHEMVPVVEEEEVVVASSRELVERIRLSPEHRAHFPIETYPVTAGLKGGIAGGIAMIFPALLYGIIAQHSIWYPINLLGGAGVAHWSNPTTAEIAAFHWQGLLVASVIHVVTCLLVGLLYGAMLPMLPRHPVILGGLIAPILWTGILHSFMGFINPALDARIAWGWFVVSQVAFGVVAGLVVKRQARIPTGTNLPLAARLGIEMPGLIISRPDAGPPLPKKDESGKKEKP